MNLPKSFDPLRERVFRRIWTASLAGNLGQLILGVAAAWEMARLSNSATMVALVQSATMLPLMLASVPAGALADMYDRRKVAMVGLFFSIVTSALMAALGFQGLLAPWLILAFCFLIGIGVAIYSPAWQASINEQVRPDHLPAAVALGTISYNVARSFGPAIGGIIVLSAGASAAFALTSLFFAPLLLAFFVWRRAVVPPRLPPEGLGRAIVSGTRFVLHSPVLRLLLGRAFAFGLTGAAATGLAPLIAKDLLRGDAATYGILLGAGGAGAVAGALFVSHVRERWSTHQSARILTVVTALGLVVVGLSRNLTLTFVAMFVIGAANILVIALYNVAVQLSAPRWVIARAVSLYSSALTGGIAVGAWVWGEVASRSSISLSVVMSGILMIALAFLLRFFPFYHEAPGAAEPFALASEPEVGLPITMRSGPIILEVDYWVALSNARSFYNCMLKLRPLRLRNGGYDWSISRDIADPTLWTERYTCPTWADFLRIRDRQTSADRDAQILLNRFLIAGSEKAVRRRLDRPFGSVRWRDETPDAHQAEAGFLGV